MNFILKPPLEHIALVKVAALLWNQHDIKALVTEFPNSTFVKKYCAITCRYFRMFRSRKDKWQKIEDQVIEKIAQLTIPSSLKEKILGYIQSVGIQILKWMLYHFKFCCFDLDLPSEFCWSAQGTVDKKKTAEVLIRDDSIDIITRYKLACLYCLEDDIADLQNKFPESEIFFPSSRYDVMQNNNIKSMSVMELAAFWTHGITVQDDRLNYGCSSYQNLFSFAVESCNKAATEYFLQKLDLKEEFLFNTALNITKKRVLYSNENDPDNEYYNEVLCFLISQMSSDQQVKLFQECPAQVVYCLLDWPFQSLLVETVIKLLCNFLPKSDYYSVFQKIIEKEYYGYKDYDYKNLFQDFWRQIPDADKNFIINYDHFNGPNHLLDMLLRVVKHKENLKLIFQSATAIEKSKFLFNDRGHYFFKYMICHKEWDSVKFFVQLLISSKNEIIKFKQQFQKRFPTEFLYSTMDENANEFYQILDDFVRGYDKRNVDDGESSSGKRLCNVEFTDVVHGTEK